MAKRSTPLTQTAFSFLDEVENVEPEPKRHVLRPPAQIEVTEEDKKPLPQAAPPATDEVPEPTIPEEASVPLDEVKDEPKTEEVIPEKKSTKGRRSVRDAALAADGIELPDDETLFQKHYYSMGEVTSMLKENHSLIRYWESEFSILKPKKNGKGDRFFRPADVKNLFLIYDLLRRRKFTIEGAREYLKNNKKADENFAAVQSLQKIRNFFVELKANL
ncbi:MAG: MerR family transcriptional regulator [Niabella sp.]